MKKNGKKKNFSIAEKVAYHKSRLESPKVKETQKLYSKNFLDGVYDEHAKVNLKEAERDFRKRVSKDINTLSFDKAGYGGYINGMKARLQEEKLKRLKEIKRKNEKK